MIINLFSVFDPTSSLGSLKLNWVSSTIIFLIILNNYWVSPSRSTILLILFSKTLANEIKTHLGNKNSIIMFVSLILFIIINNLIGLTSYTFTRTSHILLTLTLALPIWVSFIIFGWINKCNHIFAHLVPQGTPSYLIPFIVLIETIRNIIRPITLSIRLAANIIAGHLLLTLLGNQGTNVQSLILTILILSQILLLLLETAVAVIQSYVFTILSVLYSREVTYDKSSIPHRRPKSMTSN